MKGGIKMPKFKVVLTGFRPISTTIIVEAENGILAYQIADDVADGTAGKEQLDNLEWRDCSWWDGEPLDIQAGRVDDME